jgi:hypothetical protein
MRTNTIALKVVIVTVVGLVYVARLAQRRQGHLLEIELEHRLLQSREREADLKRRLGSMVDPKTCRAVSSGYVVCKAPPP